MCTYPSIEFSNPKELSGTHEKDERLKYIICLLKPMVLFISNEYCAFVPLALFSAKFASLPNVQSCILTVSSPCSKNYFL